MVSFNQLYGARHLQVFVNLINNFNSVVIKVIQQDLGRAKNRLKDPYLLTILPERYFFYLKGSIFMTSISKIGINILTTITWISQLSSQNPANNSPCEELGNLTSMRWWWYVTTPVPYNHQPLQMSDNRQGQLNSINLWYISPPYYHTMVQTSNHTSLASAGTIFYLTS